jgi:hypothetical protein
MKRTIDSRFTLSTIIFALMALAVPHAASAQITMCASGSYTLDVSGLPVGSPCFAGTGLQVELGWGSTLFPAGSPTAPGVYVIGFPSVAPGDPLKDIQVCGTSIQPAPGVYGVVCSGVHLCVAVCTDANGCLVVKMLVAPCPVIFPCP